nr:MAG TPA: hypothetical protein [Caudoviricetes sp.]
MNGTSSASQTITIPALASHTVSFNANGGTGAPGNQTKWYGTVLTLSSTKPTRTNYEFLGWSTSSTGTADYQPGGQYGADADVTLYAVWKLLYVPPKFTNALAIRTNSMTSTTPDYSGGYCYASFAYKVDTTIYPSNVAKSIVCRYYQNGSTTGVVVTPTGDLNKASGTINVHFAASINSVYYIECTLTDTKDGTATIARSITTGVLPMEVANRGKSVGILSAAPKTAGLQLGGSGNPDFLIAADTTNNQLESMAQIHGSTSSTGQGELTLSTQGTDSRGNVARGSINLVADSVKLNGSPIILNNLKIVSGSIVLNAPGGNSFEFMSLDYIKSEFGIEYSSDRTVLLVNNGDSEAANVHIEGVSYVASHRSLWCVLDRSISGLIRVNFIMFHNLETSV